MPTPVEEQERVNGKTVGPLYEAIVARQAADKKRAPIIEDVPDEIAVAVATREMPLDVFADWLEEHGHPWGGLARQLATQGEILLEADISFAEAAAAGDAFELAVLCDKRVSPLPFGTRGSKIQMARRAHKVWHHASAKDFLGWLLGRVTRQHLAKTTLFVFDEAATVT